jgi:dCMP deaminase
MKLALSLSDRSTCTRLSVGAVITSPDFRKVYAVGYNGNVAGGVNDCDRHGEEAVGNCGCLHAEENAVINCDTARHHEKIVFCTHLPCVMCAKRLINLGGVKEVYYQRDYRLKDSLELFSYHNVITGHLSDPDLGPAGAQHRSRQALHEYMVGKTRS